MATTKTYIEYVCDQLNHYKNIRYRKMFGEYMIYIDEKPVLLVCDNQVYIKMIAELNDKMNDLEQGHPYQGAKLHYILNIDNVNDSIEIINLVLPYLKVKQPK